MIFALTSLPDLVQQSAAHAWLIQRIFLARLPRAVFFERNPDLHGHLCCACRLRASALNVSCPPLFPVHRASLHQTNRQQPSSTEYGAMDFQRIAHLIYATRPSRNWHTLDASMSASLRSCVT